MLDNFHSCHQPLSSMMGPELSRVSDDMVPDGLDYLPMILANGRAAIGQPPLLYTQSL